MKIYEELERLSLPHLEAYQHDLTRIDRESIEKNPDMPFLHFTRNHGTHIVYMPPADHECWPAPGEVVPYLFGEATRSHILDQKNVVVKWCMENSGLRLCVHFDGRSLREVSPAEAVRICKEYVLRVGCEWNVKNPPRYIGQAEREWMKRFEQVA